MAKKVGELIKEARTNAGLSQTALAEKVGGLTGSDIGKAERGEKDLSQTALKAIAKATGVTQKSLLEAPKNLASAAASAVKKPAASTAKKPAASAAKTTAAKTTTAKKTATAAKKPAAAKTAAEELTSAEKTMLNAYRKADAETRKAALKLLKGEQDPDILSTLLQSFGGANGGGLLELLGSLGKK